MTNREWLESRTNEELAKILNENGVCEFFNPVSNVQRVIMSKVVVRAY